MASQAHASPQTSDVAPAQQNQRRGRGRARKSNTNLPAGHAPESSTLPASSPAQQQPKSRQPQRHNVNQHNPTNALNSPRGNARNTTPATPLKEQAYAGPTFHASPDPSSLPIPKFFRMANQTLVAPPSPGKSSDGEDISPPASPSKGSANTLDMFFAADRKERAERHSQAAQDYETHQTASPAQPRPFSSDSINWRAQAPHSSGADERVPSGSSRQQIHSPPHGARVGFDGQTESPLQPSQTKDSKSMAEDLKRILKIS